MNPFPTENWLTHVSFCNGEWIAVGEERSIYNSADGVEWSAVIPAEPDITLKGIEFGSGTWMAYGYRTYFDDEIGDTVTGATVLISTNKVDWEQINYGRGGIGRVEFQDGLWVAIQGEAILTSTNGREWTERYRTGGNVFLDLLHANGKWLAGGSGGLMMTSTNAMSWNAVFVPRDMTIYAVEYGNGKWIAVGYNHYRFESLDGMNWTEHLMPHQYPNVRYVDVAYSDGRWLAITAAPGQLASSVNGGAWTVAEFPFRTRDLYSIAANAGHWVAVGGVGEILTSTNGIGWTPRSSRLSDWLYDAEFADGKCVVVGGQVQRSGQIAVSTNAHDWAVKEMPESLSAIDFGNGVWVTVGAFGEAYISTNAVRWDRVDSKTRNSLYDVAFHQNLWVMVGLRGTVNTSTDGVNWSSQISGTTKHLYAIGASDNYWVAAGDWALLSSTNGFDWQAQIIPENVAVESVAHVNGLWIAGGKRPDFTPTILLSTNATSWEEVKATEDRIFGSIRTIEFYDGTWFASTEFGQIIRSADGRNWYREASPDHSVQDLLFFGDSALAVGTYGQISVSRASVGIYLKAEFENGQLLLSWPFTGQGYRLQSSEHPVDGFQDVIEEPSSAEDEFEFTTNALGAARYFKLRAEN